MDAGGVLVSCDTPSDGQRVLLFFFNPACDLNESEIKGCV